MIRKVADNFEEYASVLLVGALCLVVAVQVGFRWASVPLSWTEEAATIIFVWTTFVGSSLALKRGEHFAVEVLRRNIPQLPARIVSIAIGLLLIIFSLLLAVYGYRYAAQNADVLTPTMELSRAIPYSAVFGGGVLMLIRSLQITWRALLGREVKP